MNKLLLTYLFFLNCGFSIMAKDYLLQGKIVDQTGNTIEAAYVEVLKDNAQIIGYALSDIQGRFSIELSTEKEYQVNITHISYKPLSKKIIPDGNEISFIMEEHTENVDEVIVTGFAKAMKMNNEGNIVFTPKALGNIVTYNLPRLLQTLPSIRISSSGITQNGRMTALLINGHRRSLSGKSVEAFLKTIPTNKIKEIVINPTSSAGDLASENGSVNIILKKEEDLISAQIGGELNIRKGGVYGNGNTFLMYNKNKFYMDLSLGYYNLYNQTDTKRESTYANSPATSTFNYKTNSRENDYFGSLNLQWEIKDGHKLFASASGFYDNGKSHGDNRMMFHPDKERQELTNGNARQNYDDDLYTMEVEFTSNDTLRHQHTVGYGIIWGKAHNEGFNDEVTIIENINTKMSHNTINRHYGYQHQMKYNYKLLINSSSTLKAGVRVDLGELNPKSQFIEKEQSTEDFLYIDRYNLHDNVYAGFLEYSYKYKNTSISGGLRLEYTNYSALSLVDNKEYDYNRVDYFPFLSINQKVGQIATVSLRLASGIERPHFLDYVPNYRYTSKYAYSIGNPKLKPSKFYSATLGTVLLDFLYLGLTYIHTKDILSEITKNSKTSSQQMTTSMNVCDENKFIFQMNCPYAFLNDKLSGYLGVWYGHSKYTNLKVDLGDYYNMKYNGFSITNQTQYEIVNNLNIGYDIYYQPKLYLRQEIGDQFFKLGLDIAYKIKNIDIGFNISNVLNATNRGIELADQVYTKFKIDKFQPIYSMTVKYNIGNTNKRKYHEGIDSSRFK